MAADATASVTSTLWLRADLDAPELVALPGGQVAAFARGHDPECNQDALALAAFDGGRALLAVADGAGGQASGGEAAVHAVRRLLSEVQQAASRGQPLTAGILAGFDSANDSILGLGVGAASTLVVAELDGRTVRSYHAGDSAVLVTGQRGRIKLQTIAHSPVGYAQEAGMLSEREALRHDERHLVSNLLGTPEMRIEVGPVLTLAPRDTLVLGSDGLFDNLSVDEVSACIRTGSLHDAASRLSERTLDRMGHPRPGTPSKPDDIGFLVYRPTSGASR